jgi:hypothetical protein
MLPPAMGNIGLNILISESRLPVAQQSRANGQRQDEVHARKAAGWREAASAGGAGGGRPGLKEEAVAAVGTGGAGPGPEIGTAVVDACSARLVNRKVS